MPVITLLTGSTLGNAENVAEHLASLLEESGFSTTVIHGPKLHDLPLKGIWLIVTSTHGAGELPDNLSPLLQQLIEEKTDLQQIVFGAVGLGSSDYDTFCQGIKIIDDLMLQQGAIRLGERLEIDVTQYEIPEDPAEEWLKGWIPLLSTVNN